MLIEIKQKDYLEWCKMIKKPYCSQSNGDCAICGLINYNKDCKSNPLLTPTEIKIIEFIVTEALSNKTISEQIGCSERTIETHMRNILAKLKMKKREELILNIKKSE